MASEDSDAGSGGPVDNGFMRRLSDRPSGSKELRCQAGADDHSKVRCFAFALARSGSLRSLPSNTMSGRVDEALDFIRRAEETGANQQLAPDFVDNSDPDLGAEDFVHGLGPRQAEDFRLGHLRARVHKALRATPSVFLDAVEIQNRIVMGTAWSEAEEWEEGAEESEDKGIFQGFSALFSLLSGEDVFEAGYEAGYEGVWCDRCGDNAGLEADLFCVDCEAAFCWGCSGRWHHPGGCNELHSLEIIVKGEGKGLRIVTPLLDEMLICIASYQIVTGLKDYVDSRYLFRSDICPVVRKQQEWLAWADTLVFYHFKDALMASCSNEDNFWKLLMDAWVRTIVTDSDSLFLLLRTLPNALLIHYLASTLIVPPFAVAYASLLVLVRAVESRLPRRNRLLCCMAVISQQVSAASARLVSYNMQVLMHTKPRLRPSQDTFEFWTYWTGRQMRWFDFYYRSTRECATQLLANTLRCVVVFRCLGICFGFGKFVRWFLERIGMEETISVQQVWFARVYQMLDTDELVWRGVAGTLAVTTELLVRADVRGIATCLLGLAGFIALDVMLRIGVVQRRWFQQRRVQRTVLLPLLVVLVAVPTARWAFIVFYFGAALLLWSVQRLVQYITEQQQQRFEEQWNETYRGLVLGRLAADDNNDTNSTDTEEEEEEPADPVDTTERLLLRLSLNGVRPLCRVGDGCGLNLTDESTAVVTSVTPRNGSYAEGVVVTITIASQQMPDSLQVFFGVHECPNPSISAGPQSNTWVVTLPVCPFEASDVPVYVLTSSGYAAQASPHTGAAFKFQQFLQLFSIMPGSGSFFGGTVANITGAGFGPTPSTNQATIGKVPCEIFSASHDQLLCYVPAAPAELMDADDSARTQNVTVHVVTPAQPRQPGLWGEYFFFGQGSTFPNLNDRIPDVERVDLTVNFPDSDDKWEGLPSRYQYAVRWTGFLSVQATGFYTFYLGSDDGSLLYLNGALVIDNDGLHGFRERSTTETLLQGGSIHAVSVLFFQASGSSGCVFKYQGPDTGGQIVVVPPTVLSHARYTEAPVLSYMYDRPITAPTIENLTESSPTELVLEGYRFGSSPGKVAIGTASNPDTNFQCVPTSWTEGRVVCDRPELPSGSWQVRLYSEADGWSNPAPYLLWVPLTVSSVEANDNSVATDSAADPWVLIMKFADGGLLGYDSELWDNVELLNEDSPEGEPVNAKYPAFLNVPFTRLRACVGSAHGHCVHHKFDTPWSSALELFSAGYVRDHTVDQAGLVQALGAKPGTYRSCPMLMPGFNVNCPGNNRARWGYCANCPSKTCRTESEADAAIGIGLRGEGSAAVGAGWTDAFAPGAGSCSYTSETSRNVWLWVTNTTATPTGVLHSGFGGGVNMTVRGTGLGFAAAQTKISVCGEDCPVSTSDGSSATCTVPAMTNLDLVDAQPDSFPTVDLAPYAAKFYTDRGESESTYARLAFTSTVDRQVDLPNTRSSCWFGFELPPSKEAIITAVDFFPPTDPHRRQKVAESVFEMRSFSGNISWEEIGSVRDTVQTGWSIAQGWTSYPVNGSGPNGTAIGQAFRVRILPDACSSLGELMRGVRFRGILLNTGDASACAVEVEHISHPLASSTGGSAWLPVQLSYSLERTPILSSMTPQRGTARGDTLVTLLGEGLEPLDSSGSPVSVTSENAQILLNTYPCIPQESNMSALSCITSERNNGIQPPSTVLWLAGRGYAIISERAEDTVFRYVDRWSNVFSWLESEPPVDGDSVVVPEGQAIMLDQDSPQLFLLLISGYFEFDRKDLKLDATYIWISGGTFWVGSEEAPFLNQATITLHGDRWHTIELPVIGSKMLAVTDLGGFGTCAANHQMTVRLSARGKHYVDPCPVKLVGRMELHGRPSVSWTRLVETASAGATLLKLEEPVDWEVGTEMIITPSNRGQDEVRLVKSVQDDGYTVELDSPLRFEHLGIWYFNDEIPTPTDLRAGVGRLNRNVKVQGDERSLGYGNAYMFGVHVGAFHGGVMRIENTEITRSGQAANFGRYSSHWHVLSPHRTVDVADIAYLRNNSYHRTFQRAVVVHSTDFARVEHNVAWKTKGHSYFTEAGDEVFTLYNHNLAVHPLQCKPQMKRSDGTEDVGTVDPGFIPALPLLGQGGRMPMSGVGMCCRSSARGDAARQGVLDFLLQGGRHLDTAQIYGNHKEVGAGVRQAVELGVPRDQIFLTTKIWPDDFGWERTTAWVPRMLDELGLEYVDLVLLHMARADGKDCGAPKQCRQETWLALQRFQNKGQIRALGVSNFGLRQMQELADLGGSPVAANQLEYHPWVPDVHRKTVDWCHRNGVAVTAYGSMGSNSYAPQIISQGALQQIGDWHGKTAGQVLLRWAVQHNVSVIPGTSNPKHQAENLQIFDFELGSQEMALLDGIPESERHRSNLAAGCHRGWRVRLISGPAGSQTDMTFFNNSAHASGFGWHLKPPHAPPTLNVFQNFTAVRCSTGMFYYGTGNIFHDDHRFIECGTGHFMNHLSNGPHTAPFYHNLVLVGNIDQNPTFSRGGVGVRGPKDNEYFYVSGLTVINYLQSAVLHGCFETTCTMRYERIRWFNSTRRTYSYPSQSGIYWDMDGTLTGYTNGFVSLNYEYMHFPGICAVVDEHVNGVMCGASDGSVRVRRLLVNEQQPWQLDGKLMNVRTSAGFDQVKYDTKKLSGWPVIVLENETFDTRVDDPNDFQELAFLYSQRPYVMESLGYIYNQTTPMDEAIIVHVNFTDWRDHYDADASTALRLDRMPTRDDPFGSHSMMLWQDQCDEFNLTDEVSDKCGVYVNDTGLALKAEIDSQPTVDMVHGRLTTVFTMKVQEGTPGGSFRNKFYPRECPKSGCPQPNVVGPGGLRPLRRWSDPEGWPDGKLPAEMDNVVLPPDDNVLLDIETPKLHWLDVQGRLEFDRTVNTTLHAHSVKVWGIFEMGTAEEPIPPGVKAEVVLWGDEQSITVIMVEGLFLVNKVIAVLGQFSAVGSPSTHSQAWTRLATIASEGATELTLRGNQSDWPMGSQIAISATEFPQPPATTETEVRQIASKPVYDAVADTTTFSLDTNLTFRHFAGVVDSSSENTQWPRPVLAAAVALLDGRSNVVLRTGEADTDHGGELVIAGSSDGRWEGLANVSNIDFVRMGKHLYQAPAMKFNFLGGQNNMSSVENCVFSHSQSGAIEANHVSHLRIVQNVFHRTFRSAVWLRDSCRHDSIVLHKNIAIETFRHPRESRDWIRQFGSFFLEVRPGELVGNVAAGSTDTGFILRPQLQTCQKGDVGTPKLQQDEMNEAVAAMRGAQHSEAEPKISSTAAKLVPQVTGRNR
ncbi:PKHD1L1 [Symbiodinium sp. CCMP2456]|nr:PKHD1L1 [Symbiodinium sp. CCMP2456]